MSIDCVALALSLCLALSGVEGAFANEHGAAAPVAHEEHSGGHDDLVERAARTGARDVKIPKSLVKKIEDDYQAFLKQNKIDAKAAFKRQLLNVSVELTQEKAAALFESVRILTPIGGGVVDLNEFVSPVKGSFNLKIVTRDDNNSEPPDLRTYYVSRARQRSILNDAFGAGCGKYMEITRYFAKKNAGDGIKLYTADRRYLSVLAGTFVQVAYSADGIAVGSVTFTDSRYPEVICE